MIDITEVETERIIIVFRYTAMIQSLEKQIEHSDSHGLYPI